MTRHMNCGESGQVGFSACSLAYLMALFPDTRLGCANLATSGLLTAQRATHCWGSTWAGCGHTASWHQSSADQLLSACLQMAEGCPASRLTVHRTCLEALMHHIA